jgi:hypothetical protein
LSGGGVVHWRRHINELNYANARQQQRTTEAKHCSTHFASETPAELCLGPVALNIAQLS